MILSGQSPPEIFVDGEERDIKIRPNIVGTEVVLLGATPAGKREIIIEVVGPKRNITLQEKRRFLGLWLGLGKINYNNVPSYYNILSSKPLNEISDQETFNKLGLGLENLPLGKAEIINSDLKQRIFDKRLRTEMQNKKLDYKSVGLNSSKYEIDSIDKNVEENLEMINIKTFYDN